MALVWIWLRQRSKFPDQASFTWEFFLTLFSWGFLYVSVCLCIISKRGLVVKFASVTEAFQTCRLVLGPEGWEGGGGTPDFKWQRWSNGGKNPNPKKSLVLKIKPKETPGPKFNPQKIPCRISEPKGSSNDYSISRETNGDDKKWIEALVYTPGHFADYWLADWLYINPFFKEKITR